MGGRDASLALPVDPWSGEGEGSVVYCDTHHDCTFPVSQ